jgi:glycosyltransferase involved in cell wall biosynthesis
MYELATELYARGHAVTVLTSFPGYNIADPKTLDQIQERVTENGITVLRAKTMPLKKVGYLLRGLAELTLPFNLWNLLKKNASDFDIIWVFSPPLPLAILSVWLKKHFRSRMLLNVQDIFPQNAIDLGIIKNRAAILWYEIMERLSCRFSDLILVHSDRNRDFLLKEKNVPNSKVVTQYNWVDMVPFDRAKRTGKFREMYGLNSQVVALFAGVIGPAQGLDVLIEVASRLKNEKDMVFLLVGDGSQKERLQSKAKKRGITNISFHPFVSKEEYPYLVKDADIGLVCLSDQMKTPVVPGKIQGYMAAGVPILAILNKESDGHTLIQDAQAGRTVLAGNVEDAVNSLRELKLNTDLRKKMGESGHKFAAQKLSKTACVDNILGLVERL